MDLKPLGKSQRQLPEIGFGTANRSCGVEPLRAAIEQGAYLIDTAESYGTEEVVGKAVQGNRAAAFIATKVSPWHFRRGDLIASAESSLRRLGTDYIDLYQLHWPNSTIPIAEPMAALEELVQAGKIRFIGVSNFSVGELKKAQAALTRNRIVSNQVLYNLMDRTIEQDLLPYCREAGVTILAYRPLGAGIPKLRALDLQNMLAGIASKTGKSEAQVALNWVTREENVIAIPGASKEEHVIDDCGASGWRLSQEDYEMLSANIRCRRRSRVESAARRLVRNALQKIAGRGI